jgi:hypothetical protein
MSLLAVAFASVIFPPLPILLEEDACEIQQRDLSIPVWIRPGTEKEVRVRLFLSTDRGATWKAMTNVEKAPDKFLIIVPKDGLYWFSLQTTGVDEKGEREDVKDLLPHLKIYVNSQKRPVINLPPPQAGKN